MRSATLQRKCACGGTCGSCRDTAPHSVQRVLASPGQPLEGGVRTQMESRFGHDFSRVRLHTDAVAAASARDVSARAYTVGDHIAFAPGAYGQQLLAHELTHTIQQERAQGGRPGEGRHEAEADRVAARVASGRDAGPISPAPLQIARAPQEPETAPVETEEAPPPQTGKVVKGNPRGECGRKTNVRVPGFDNTTAGPHISAIDVEILTNAHSPVKLTWMNVPAGATVETKLNGSPGAGLCQMWSHKKKVMEDVDCSDPTWSNTTDSLCTPIGNFTVQGFACSLGDAKASRVTWFHHDRGIAFHNYDPVPAQPASHGCVRIADQKADWIYDNAIPNVTTVSIKRAAGDPGPKCYSGKTLKDRPGYVPPQQPGSSGQQSEEVDGP